MTDLTRLTILAHLYAFRILQEYNGSYKRALEIGFIKAKRKLSWK